MQKIPTLFVRDHESPSLVTTVVTPGCEWVMRGKGRPTRKWDGTACLVRDGSLYKRYMVKHGRKMPDGFEPTGEPSDTGKQPGWVPVGMGPMDQWRRETSWKLPDGTYELVGPNINGNPDGFDDHTLVRHGASKVRYDTKQPMTFEFIRDVLTDYEIEGIVWHRPDGQMAKVKRKDFGLPWPVRKT